MKQILKRLWFVFLSIRLIPHILVFVMHPNRKIIKEDLLQWLLVLRIKRKGIYGFIYLLNFIKEYRNIFYLRIGFVGKILNVLAGKLNPSFIYMESKHIGSGFVLQHGFSSVINAINIGKNCQVWHNVTIGLSESGTDKKPILKDNVKVCAGAIVVGGITLGNNVTVGAAAVVTKSIPDNCTVVGNPAVIVKKDGIKVYERL